MKSSKGDRVSSESDPVAKTSSSLQFLCDGALAAEPDLRDASGLARDGEAGGEFFGAFGRRGEGLGLWSFSSGRDLGARWESDDQYRFLYEGESFLGG